MLESRTHQELIQATQAATRHLPVPGAKRAGWLARIQGYVEELWTEVAEPEAQLYLSYGLAEGSLAEVSRSRALWHIRRLQGFGGSDMGILYTEHQGGVCPFSDTATAREVVAQKLLESVPVGVLDAGTEEEMSHLIRGKVFEGPIERTFLRQHRADGLYEDVQARERLRAFMAQRATRDPHSATHPWLHGMPDGIYLDRSGRRWLVDFKAPADEQTVRSYSTRVPQYYEGQLAHYALLMKEAGVPADRVLLVPYSWANMRTSDCLIEVTDAMIENVIAAGEHYFYDCLLRLEVPAPRARNGLERIDEVSPELEREMKLLVAARRVETLAKDRASLISERIRMLIHEAGHDTENAQPGTTLAVGQLLRGRRQDYPSVNLAVLKEDAKAAGLDPDDPKYQRTSHSYVLSTVRSKKAPGFPEVQRIKEASEAAFNDAMADLSSDFDNGGLDPVADEAPGLG